MSPPFGGWIEIQPNNIPTLSISVGQGPSLDGVSN